MNKHQKLIPWRTLKKELLANPEVKRVYDELGPEYALINRLIDQSIIS